MVCSCTMSSNCVWLCHLAANNILLMCKRTHAFLLAGKWQIASLPEDIPRPVSRGVHGVHSHPPTGPKGPHFDTQYPS